MKFSVAALHAALGGSYGEPAADRLRAYLAADGDRDDADQIHHLDIGAPLAAAFTLAGVSADEAASLPLTDVELACGARSATLDPDDAFNHPLLGPWIADSFGGALAMVFNTGAMMGDLAADAPVFLHGELGEDMGAVSAAFTFQFGSATAVARYGSPLPEVTLATVRHVSGPTLYETGRRAADYSQNIAPAELAAAVAGAIAVEDAAVSTLH